MSEHVVTSREYRANSKTNELFIGIILVIFGLITAVCGQDMLNITVSVVGVLFIILGLLIYMDTKVLQSSAFNLILGTIFLVLGLVGLADDIIRLVFGLMIILAGVFILLGTNVRFAGYEFKEHNVTVVTVIIGIGLIILGIIAMINYAGSFDLLIRIIGIVILAFGAIDIAKALCLIKN